jgi:hypothetical protein
VPRVFPRLIALLFHLPGLRLFAGRGLPVGAGRENVVAVLLTLGAMALAAWRSPADGRTAAVVVTWAVGHLAWGARLAWWIAREQRERPASGR